MTDFEFADDLRAHAAKLEPDEAALERLSQGVSRPPRARSAAARVAAALAAAAALGLGAWWLGAPRPREVALGAGEVTLSEGVLAVADGSGHAYVEGPETTITWQHGRLAVEVQAAAGLSVIVETEEAFVRVVGTTFTVDRGPFGTEVEVERGRVEARCRHTARSHLLDAGGQAICLRSAGAGLGRLLALEGDGASASERLAAIEVALTQTGGDDEVRVVLGERRVRVLAELDRTDEALRAALALPDPSRRSVLSALADRALADDDCGTAEPWLVALQRAGDPVGTLLRVQCLADRDPARAREALETLSGLQLSPTEAAAVDAWWEQLRPSL